MRVVGEEGSGQNSPTDIDKPISPSVNIKRLASDMNQKALHYNQSRASYQTNSEYQHQTGGQMMFNSKYFKHGHIPSVGNNLGLKASHRYMSLLGGSVDLKASAKVAAEDPPQTARNMAQFHKRQYEKALDKFRVLEQGLTLKNSYYSRRNVQGSNQTMPLTIESKDFPPQNNYSIGIQ